MAQRWPRLHFWHKHAAGCHGFLKLIRLKILDLTTSLQHNEEHLKELNQTFTKEEKISFPIFFRHFLSQREPVVKDEKKSTTFKHQLQATGTVTGWASLLRNANFSITTSNFQRCQGQTSHLEEICVVFPCTHCLRVWVYRSKPLSAKVGLIKLSQSHLQLHHLHNHLRMW